MRSYDDDEFAAAQPPRAAAFAATLLALMLIAAACGDSGEGTSPTQVPATEPAETAGVTLAPTTTSAPPDTTSVATTALGDVTDLVVIGDSFVGWSSWPELYAEMIEDALGVTVELHTDLAGSATRRRLDQIKNDPSARELIARAEVIVVQPQPGFAAQPAWNAFFAEECGGDDNQQCFQDTAVTYRAYMDEYLDLLVELAQPGAVIRVARTATWGPDGFLPDLREEDPIALEVLIEGVVAMMNEVEASAQQRGILTIDVGAAFNGPDYRDLAPVSYLISDRLHLDTAGSEVVAELLDGLGYEPTINP